MKKSEYINRVPISKDNKCLYREEDKCTNCGACKGICNFRIGVYGHYDMAKSPHPRCIYCGQCSLVCPNNCIKEFPDYKKIIADIKSGYTIICQIAPATRFLVGDSFGYKPGKNVIGKIISSLKKMGVTYVVDTSFGADLTIVEEANELITRINNQEKLPMFTSCCPSWVEYLKLFYPEYQKNLSTTKSPILMCGSIIKNYLAPKNKLDKSKIKVVAIVPCTAKKYEITKTDDVDYAITVRELCTWIKESKIDFRKMKPLRFDNLTGTSSGVIFGASGGVAEAMTRYLYHKLTYKSPPKKLLNFETLRGLDDIKEATIKIKDKEIRIAVVNGTGDIPRLFNQICQNDIKYDIIEVVACDGGCIAGGGGPKNFKITNTYKELRSKAIYKKDKNVKRRNSYENPQIKKLYKELLSKPNSDKAIELLHTKGE